MNGRRLDGCLDSIDSLDDLVASIRHHERFGAQIALAAARLNTVGAWADDGALSMAAWLRHHSKSSHLGATRLLREGKFLDRFDDVADAAVSGVLAASQVAALRAVVSRPTAELFEAHQAGVIEAIKDLSAADTEVVCQQWRDRAESVVDMPEPTHRERHWSSSKLEDGSIVGNFAFDAVGGEILDTALQTARRFDGADDNRTAARRNADAMIEILGYFNANNSDCATPRHHPNVELVITADQLDHLDHGECVLTANGALLPTWAVDAFLCDCVIHRVMRSAAGTIIDYGHAVRTVPAPLWKAVAIRDQGCRVPGCDRKKAWCDVHHIVWWRKNGATKMDNLLMLCAHHHRLVHQQNWTVVLDAHTGEVTFTLPNGRVMITTPRGQPTIRAA